MPADSQARRGCARLGWASICLTGECNSYMPLSLNRAQCRLKFMRCDIAVIASVGPGMQSSLTEDQAAQPAL